MPTNYTPLNDGDPADASTFNDVFDELDVALIGTQTAIGSALSGGALAANTVNTTQIVAGAVTNAKLANDSVGLLNIQDDAVTANKIAAGAVTASEIQDNAVTTAKIADGQVTPPKLAAGATAAILTQGLSPLANYPKREGPATYPTAINAATLGTSYSEPAIAGGTFLTIDDTSDKLSVVAGTGFTAASAATALTDPRIIGRLLGRRSGRLWHGRFQVGTSARMGFKKSTDTGATVRTGVEASSGTFRLVMATGNANLGITHDPTHVYDVWIVQCDIGGLVYYRDVTAGNPIELLGVMEMYASSNENTTSPTLTQLTYGGTATQVAVYDMPALGGKWSFAFAPNSLYHWERLPTAYPFTATMPSGDGAALFEAKPLAGDTVEMRFRDDGAGNCMAVQLLETADQLQIVKYTAGVPAVIAGPVAITVATSTIYTLFVKWKGSAISVVATPSVITVLNVTDASYLTQTGVTFPASMTSDVSRVALWEVYGVPALPLTEGMPLLTAAVSGSSKSAQSGTPEDHAEIGRTGVSWEWAFRQEAEGIRDAGAYVCEIDATGTRSNAAWLGTLPGIITTVQATYQVPDVWFIELGTQHRGDPQNGGDPVTGSGAAQTTEAANKVAFQADLRAGLVLLNTAFPNMLIICGNPSGTTPGWTVTLADGRHPDDVLYGWIYEVVMGKYYCVMGVDERYLYRNSALGFIGADGVHPTYAGYKEYGRRQAQIAAQYFGRRMGRY